MGFEHRSVMPHEIHEHQNLKPGNICVDCTLGGAGHGLATVKAIQPDGIFIGIDQDKDAIDHAQNILSSFRHNTHLFHSNFIDLPAILNTINIQKVHSIVLDLGFSLNQIRHSKRGFSFRQDEPLDMRMDTRNSLTAAHIVNSFKETQLIDLFFKLGEEKFSRRIARAITKKREEAPFTTSLELADTIKKAVPAPKKGFFPIHPATRVFQALRIRVNRELEKLETFLKTTPELLLKGGRLLVISFHSLEDRIVKQSIQRFEKGCTCPKDFPICNCGFIPTMKSIFKKPLIPSPVEIQNNFMARSAKLRVAERI